MARPTKLTPDLIAAAARHLRAGQWAVTTAALIGVTEQTYYNWFNRGRAELERVAEDDRRSVRKDERIYVRFFESCTRARAEAEAKSVVRIQQAAAEAGEGDWKADAWFLERAFPRRWGRQHHEVTHGGEVSIRDVTKIKNLLNLAADDDS